MKILKDTSSYLNFLMNPQLEGAWCLRVTFSDKGRKEFEDLFRVERARYDSYYLSIRNREPGFVSTHRRSTHERQPSKLLRAFAYCESLMPADIRKDTLIGREFVSSFILRSSERRLAMNLYQAAEVPKKVSQKKRILLKPASEFYANQLSKFRPETVPENPTKLDFVNVRENEYFQVAEEPSGDIRIMSPEKAPLDKIQAFFCMLPIETPNFNRIKIFSPLETLSEMMVPIINIIPSSMISIESRTLQNIVQISTEISEGRFVHSIRASGIAVEELLSEVFESYFAERTPDSPLGTLLNEIDRRVAKALGKTPKQTKKNGFEEQFDAVLEEEKAKKKPNVSLIVLAAAVKAFAKEVERLSQRDDHHSRPSNSSLFPSHVNSMLREFVSLRNKVSHRPERIRSISSVGYVEASTALRTLSVLGLWWEGERAKLDYSANLVKQTVERNSGESTSRESSRS